MTDMKIIRGSVGTRNFNTALVVIMIFTVGVGAYIFDIYNKQATERFGFETPTVINMQNVSADMKTEVPDK